VHRPHFGGSGIGILTGGDSVRRRQAKLKGTILDIKLCFVLCFLLCPETEFNLLEFINLYKMIICDKNSVYRLLFCELYEHHI